MSSHWGTVDLLADTVGTHEIFASLGAMEGVPGYAPARANHRSGAVFLRTVYPGVLASLTTALAATWLSQHYSTPVMLLALMLGMAFHFLHEEGRCVAGIDFCSRMVLRVGVALLGARITIAEISGLGPMPVATVVMGVVTTILFGVFASRWLGLNRQIGFLSGGAVGICGALAALAIAAVLPRTPQSERDTILTVVTVTALSTIAMIAYPLLATAFHLDHQSAGIFLGGTIHDVAQVVGAGYTISPETGDVATYVKLLRVSMLLPVVFGLAFVLRRSRGEQAVRVRPPLPFFLFGFAALVALGSLGFLPKPVADSMSDVSRWCLVTAIAALGMRTSLRDLITVGWKPVMLMVAETLWIGSFVLSVILFTSRYK